MLGAREKLHYSLVLINKLNKTESAVFIYYTIVGSDPVFLQIIYCVKSVASLTADSGVASSIPLSRRLVMK